MITGRPPDRSIRRSSFRNSICRDGDNADFRLVEDEDALALAALLEENAKKPSPCECERKSGGMLPAPAPGLIEIARDREEALGAKEPSVGDLGQPARAHASDSVRHRFERIGMIDRPIAFAAPASS